MRLRARLQSSKIVVTKRHMPDSKKKQDSKQIPANYQQLAGSEWHPSSKAKLVGSADPNEKFPVTIVLRRRPDGPPMPNFDSYAKIPPRQRRRLPEADFAAKYGAAPSDITSPTTDLPTPVRWMASSTITSAISKRLSRRCPKASGTGSVAASRRCTDSCSVRGLIAS